MQINNQNKLVSYFLILLSIFLLLFFVKDSYFKLQENLDSLSIKNTGNNDKKETLAELNSIKQKPWLENVVKKYIHNFDENEILDYFYAYVNKNKFGSWYSMINSINLEKWSKNEYGFNEWKINLSVVFSDEIELFKMLNFITWKTSIYSFFIDNFTFPNEPNSETWFQVNIPIRVFYK